MEHVPVFTRLDAVSAYGNQAFIPEYLANKLGENYWIERFFDHVNLSKRPFFAGFFNERWEIANNERLLQEFSVPEGEWNEHVERGETIKERKYRQIGGLLLLLDTRFYTIALDFPEKWIKPYRVNYPNLKETFTFGDCYGSGSVAVSQAAQMHYDDIYHYVKNVKTAGTEDPPVMQKLTADFVDSYLAEVLRLLKQKISQSAMRDRNLRKLLVEYSYFTGGTIEYEFYRRKMDGRLATWLDALPNQKGLMTLFVRQILTDGDPGTSKNVFMKLLDLYRNDLRKEEDFEALKAGLEAVFGEVIDFLKVTS